MFLPAGTPAAIAQRLSDAVMAVLKEDEVKKRLIDLGAQPIGSSPADFTSFLQKEDTKWGEVVRKGNIQLD